MIVVGKSPNAKSMAKAVFNWADEELIESKDIIVVVGGDGYLLGSASKHGLDKTYIPINGGHLGFLMNESTDIKDGIRYQEWTVQGFHTLEAQFGSGKTDFAINDVYIERASGQTARISVAVDGASLVQKMVADGVIVATPLGSTGYNFSAGGPVIHPLNKNMVVTPNNAHHPNFRSVVLPGTTEVIIRAEDTKYRPVRVVTDGRVHDGETVVRVVFGEQTLKLGYFAGHNFTRRLVEKILNRRN